MVRYRMIYCTQNPYQHLNNLRNPSYDHANLRNPSKGARADTQTTLDICQDPVPSRPGTKYPVRGKPSLRYACTWDVHRISHLSIPTLIVLNISLYVPVPATMRTSLFTDATRMLTWMSSTAWERLTNCWTKSRSIIPRPCWTSG